MTIAHAISAPSRNGPRWLLLGSLALNLFFIGITLAMAIRAPAPPQRWDRDVFVRVERLASTLPQADAGIMRDAMQANHDAIENAQRKYHKARDHIREALREDPFKVEDLRTAMTETRAARQAFDQVIQGVFADIVSDMSSAGRHAVASWSNRKPREKTQQ
jgi:uncharacterized membrane protein